MLFFIFFLCLILSLGFSWFNFFSAGQDPNQIYLPLESYFFTQKLDANSHLYNKSYFFITDFDFKVNLTQKIFSEVYVCFFLLILILLFIKMMSCHEWFIFSSNANDKQKIPIIGKSFKWLSVKLQDKLNIFNLSFQQITMIALILAFIFSFLLPNDSSDLYGYIARGALQSNWELNPYHFLVADIFDWQNQPLLANINPLWALNPAPYGAFYMLVYKALAYMSMNNFLLAFAIFKLFNFGIFAGTLLLLTQILNDNEFTKDFFEKKSLDSRQVFSYKKIIYSLVALNPFVLMEVSWNAHNDLFMGFLILTSLYLCYKGKFNSSLIILCLSFLSKYLSIVIFPFVLIYTISKTKSFFKFPWLGVITSSTIIYILWTYYTPFAVHAQKINHNLSLCHKSLLKSINTVYKSLIGFDLPEISKLISLGLFALILIYLIYKFIKIENKKKNLFLFCFLSMFLLIFVFSAKFHSWYLLMILPFGIFVHPKLILLLSATHLLSFTFLDQANIINFLIMTLIPSIIYFKYLRTC